MLSKEACDNQAIKRSLCYRAKYKVGQGDEPTYKTVSPFYVVPHPHNRSGLMVTSLRTKQLSGTVAKEACDSAEANNSAVAVEERPQDGSAAPPNLGELPRSF